jgi:hypothetical protein
MHSLKPQQISLIFSYLHLDLSFTFSITILIDVKYFNSNLGLSFLFQFVEVIYFLMRLTYEVFFNIIFSVYELHYKHNRYDVTNMLITYLKYAYEWLTNDKYFFGDY